MAVKVHFHCTSYTPKSPQFAMKEWQLFSKRYTLSCYLDSQSENDLGQQTLHGSGHNGHYKDSNIEQLYTSTITKIYYKLESHRLN